MATTFAGKESEGLRHARVERAARAELRRADADAGAVAQLVDAVEHVEHRQPALDLAQPAAEVERLRQRRIDLRVARQVPAVGEAAAQAAAQAAAEQRVRTSVVCMAKRYETPAEAVTAWS